MTLKNDEIIARFGKSLYEEPLMSRNMIPGGFGQGRDAEPVEERRRGDSCDHGYGYPYRTVTEQTMLLYSCSGMVPENRHRPVRVVERGYGVVDVQEHQGVPCHDLCRRGLRVWAEAVDHRSAYGRALVNAFGYFDLICRPC